MMHTKALLLLGGGLIFANIACGSVLPVEHSNSSEAGSSQDASSLVTRLEPGVSDPHRDSEILLRLQQAGQRLLQKMLGPAIEAEQRKAKAGAQEFRRSGWTTATTFGFSHPMPDLSHLRGAFGVEGFCSPDSHDFWSGTSRPKKLGQFKANGVRLDPELWAKVRQMQNKPYTVEGTTHPASHGAYEGLHSLENLVMVVQDFAVPWPQNLVSRDGTWPTTTYHKPAPPIRDFSDLALAAYLESWDTGERKTKPHMTKGTMVPPMFIDVQWETVPEETRKAMVSCLANYGISDLPGGDGITFPIGTFGYEVLLGTSPIQHMAQFLIHQKWKFENAVIGSITVRDGGATQNKALGQNDDTQSQQGADQDEEIEDKTPHFTLYVQRETKLLKEARSKNKAFEDKRERAFQPYPGHGPLSSKKGPFWPFPMRIEMRKGATTAQMSGNYGAGGAVAGPSGGNPSEPQSGSQSGQKQAGSQQYPGYQPNPAAGPGTAGMPAQGQAGYSDKGKQRMQEPAYQYTPGQKGWRPAPAQVPYSGKGKQAAYRVQGGQAVAQPAQGQTGGTQYQYAQLPQYQYNQPGQQGQQGQPAQQYQYNTPGQPAQPAQQGQPGQPGQPGSSSQQGQPPQQGQQGQPARKYGANARPRLMPSKFFTDRELHWAFGQYLTLSQQGVPALAILNRLATELAQTGQSRRRKDFLKCRESIVAALSLKIVRLASGEDIVTELEV